MASTYTCCVEARDNTVRVRSNGRLMPKPVSFPPAGFDELSVDEKINYLQALWDRIAVTPKTIAVPDWHRKILDERLKDLDADPAAGDSWEVVQQRLRKKPSE